MSEDAEPLEYVEGPGPGIPELPQLSAEELAQQQAQVQGVPPAAEYPGWEREHIDTFLLGLGQGVHMLIGVAEHDWEMTRVDLERIAPPMQRIANRWEPALRASAYADPFMVAYGVTLWAWRSALERARALKDQEAAQEEQGGGARYERAGAQAAPEEPEGPELDLSEQPTTDFQAVRPLFPQAAQKRWKP